MNPSVIVAFCSKNFRALCDMPTDYNPSVYPSLIVAFCCKCFQTLCEIPMDLIPSVCPSVTVAFCCNSFRTLCEIPMDEYPSVVCVGESVGNVIGVVAFHVINFELSVRYRRMVIRRHGRW